MSESWNDFFIDHRFYSVDGNHYCRIFESLGMIYVYETETNRLVGSDEISKVRNNLRTLLKHGRSLS